MAKVGIFIEDNYQVLEVWYPYLRLKEEGIESVFIGTGSKSQYKSKEGYLATAEVAIDNINPKDFQGIIIPGGYAPDILRRYKKVNTFVMTLFKENKLVAAICHGAWVLVSAGILKDRKITCFFAIKDDVKNAGAEFINQEVVVDNNLITSRCPLDLPAFCVEIIRFLRKERNEN